MTTQQLTGHSDELSGLLDAALIVKNEEAHLPRCLEALTKLRPLLGDICVYDTGSTDRTVEICEAAGCRVQRGYWDDDFARARNEASAMTTATWVLHVDADETVVADPVRLRELLRRATVLDLDVLWFPIRSWDDGRLLGDSPIGRLVRRATTTFVGRVHEHAAIVGKRDLTGLQIPADTLLAQHLGYSGPGTLQRKSARNAAISEAEVRACRLPGAPESELQFALIHRARALVNVGDLAGAERDLIEVRGLTENLPTRRYAAETLVDFYLSDGRHSEAARLVSQLDAEGADPTLVRWKAGLLLAAEGEYQAAWQLVSRIDNVRGSLGETLAPAAILSQRLRLGLSVADYEDVAATSLALVVGHGRVEYLPVVIQAWALWPPQVPARLLSEASGDFLPRIRAALVAQGDSAAGIVSALDELMPIGDPADSSRTGI